MRHHGLTEIGLLALAALSFLALVAMILMYFVMQLRVPQSLFRLLTLKGRQHATQKIVSPRLWGAPRRHCRGVNRV
jgi:hypothetical protein